MNDLHNALHSHQRVALCGLGGIGKTQVTLQYAHLHRTDYRAVLWVSADSAQRLQAELSALAAPLGLPVAQEQALNVRRVLEWLSADDLVVFDNADEPAAIKAWLPATAQVLLSSRASSLRPLAESLPVDK